MLKRRRRRPAFERLEERRPLAVFASSQAPTPIPDSGRLASTISTPPVVVTDLDVELNLTHARPADLEAFLTSPSGGRVRLFGFVGRPGQEFDSTRFDDEAATAVDAGADSFRMRLRPDESLATFDGAVPGGAWALELYDRAAGATGELRSWSLAFNEPPPALQLQSLRFVASNNQSLSAPIPDGGFVSGMPAPGETIYLRAEWNASNLTSSDRYRVRFWIDGSPLQSALLTGGPNHTGSHFWWLGGWTATPGRHTAEVRLDADDGVRELDESDNRIAFTFDVLDVGPAAEPFPAGDDVASIDQSVPDVGVDDSGAFTVVWQDESPAIGGGSVFRVLGRRYDPEGRPLGGSFVVSDATSSGITPSIAMNGDGQFAVVWRGVGVRVRLFAADGTPRGPSFRIDGDAPWEGFPWLDYRPSIGIDAAGDGVVVWAGRAAFGASVPERDNDEGGVYFRRFSAAGLPIGDPHLVNQVTAGDQNRPSVAMNARGEWTVAWASCVSFECAPAVRRFDSTGNPRSDETPLEPPGRFDRDDVIGLGAAIDAYGRAGAPPPDAGWRLDPTGASPGRLAGIRSATTGLAMHDSGRMIAVSATDGASVRARLFDENGTPLNVARDLEVVRRDADYGVESAATAVNARGDFVVVWVRRPAIQFGGPDRQVFARPYRWNLDVFEQPDLAAARLAPAGDSIQHAWGGPIELELVVANLGPSLELARAGGSEARLYLSTNDFISPFDLPLGSPFSLPSLAGGESTAVSTSGLRLPELPAGFPETGVVYVGLVVDSSNAVDEIDESNNSNRGRSIDVIPIRIGPPRAVTLLTHGLNFDPPRLGPAPWPEFLEPWLEDHPRALRESLAGTPWEGQVEVLTGTWDSVTGFWPGLADEVALQYLTQMFVPESPLQFLVDPLLLRDLLKDPWKTLGAELRTLVAKSLAAAVALSENDLDVARGLAAAAAADFVRQLTESGELLAAPSAGQCVQLIGHSRGAAVNARVAQLLSQRGYRVVEYVALDGFAPDWPDPPGLIGDFDLVRPVAVDVDVPIRTNVRVQDDATEAMLKYALTKLPNVDADDADAMFDAVARVLAVPEGWHDWRAPERLGFENRMLPQEGVVRSNHSTVDELFFQAAAKPDERRHLRNGFYGTSTPATCQPTAGESEPPPGGTAAADGFWSDLRDGSLDQMAGRLADFAELAPLIGGPDEFLSGWVASLQTPERWLQSAWSAKGDVTPVGLASDPALRLVQTDDTSIGQVVLLDGRSGRLNFELTVLAAGPDDDLRIDWGGSPLAVVPLSSLGTTTVVVDLPGDYPTPGLLSWRLTGPNDLPSIVELDDLQVRSGLRLTSLTATPERAEAGESIVWTAEFDERFAGEASQVEFFRETNGRPGLQFGAGGDERAGFDSNGADGWSIETATYGYSPTGHRLYAVAVDSLQRSGAAVETRMEVAPRTAPWRNLRDPLDVDDDGQIAPIDALLVINEINSDGSRALPPPLLFPNLPPPFLDVNGDDFVAPVDALLVINRLNNAVGAEGEPAPPEPVFITTIAEAEAVEPRTERPGTSAAAPARFDSKACVERPREERTIAARKSAKRRLDADTTAAVDACIEREFSDRTSEAVAIQGSSAVG